MSVLPRPMGVVPRVPVSPAPAGAGALCRTVSLPHPPRFVNYFWHRVFDVPFFTSTQPLREYWCASCLPPSQQCRNALSPVGATIGRPSTPVKGQQKQTENFFNKTRATGGRPYKIHVFFHYYCASYCPTSVAEARVGRWRNTENGARRSVPANLFLYRRNRSFAYVFSRERKYKCSFGKRLLLFVRQRSFSALAGVYGRPHLRCKTKIPLSIIKNRGNYFVPPFFMYTRVLRVPLLPRRSREP